MLKIVKRSSSLFLEKICLSLSLSLISPASSCIVICLCRIKFLFLLALLVCILHFPFKAYKHPEFLTVFFFNIFFFLLKFCNKMYSILIYSFGLDYKQQCVGPLHFSFDIS